MSCISQCLICYEICIDKEELASHHKNNHKKSPCPLSCWTCGDEFNTKKEMNRHFNTVKHQITAKKMTILPEDLQKTDFLFEIIPESMRYTAYIQEINEDQLPRPQIYNYSARPLTDKPRIIPLEIMDQTNPPTDPRKHQPQQLVSEQESLEIMQFLKELQDFDKSIQDNEVNPSPHTQNPLEQLDSEDNNWLTLDSTGEVEISPEYLLPPTEIDYFDQIPDF